MNLTKIILKSTLITVTFLSFYGCAKSVETASIMSVQKTALNGYDPVAYFVSSKALKAGKLYVYNYAGLTWNFESEANLEAFKSNPNAYIPSFGGFCAYALADEDLVLSDPKYWYIHDEKLYLFQDEDAKKEWFIHMDSMLSKAQIQWKVFNPLKEEKFEEIGNSFIKTTTL